MIVGALVLMMAASLWLVYRRAYQLGYERGQFSAAFLYANCALPVPDDHISGATAEPARAA